METKGSEATKPDIKDIKKGTTLIITGGKVGEEHPHVRKTQWVQWRSSDNRYELTFNKPPAPDQNPWPFDPPVEIPIVVEAGAYSKWYRIRGDAVDNAELPDHTRIGYGYTIDPPPPRPAPRPVPEVVPDP